MKVEQVLLTPSAAIGMLSCNTANRKLRQTGVNTFIKKIANGEWKLTHQGIAIADDGTVLDGQHRLHAIAKSGTPVPVMLATGCDKSMFSAIDAGIPRNNVDLTKLPKRLIEMLTILGYMSGNMRNKFTPGEVLVLNEKFGIACQSVIDFAPSSRRAVSAAPIRAAVALLVMEGFGDYARDMYRRLTLMDFEGMPKVMQIFVKQILTTPNVGGSAQVAQFCKALKAFDPREKNAMQCAYNEAMRDRAMERVSNLSEN